MATIGPNEVAADYAGILAQRRFEYDKKIRSELAASVADINATGDRALLEATEAAEREALSHRGQDVPDDIFKMIALHLREREVELKTNTQRAVVLAVNQAEVVMQAGPPNSCDIKGRWIGSEAPKVGQVVTYINEGRGVPIVLGTSGQDTLGKLTKFTTYTPLWTGDGGLPSIGNGRITGQYIKAEQWCWFQVTIVPGGATTYGAGLYNISLPFQAANLNAGEQQSIEAHLLNPLSARYRGIGVINSGAYSVQVAEPSSWGSPSGQVWTATTPFTFGPGDLCEVHGLYRTA